MHFGAIKPIFENAAYLRKNMTHEEKLVWAYLANNQMGFKFRRQHPLWMYIADFYCHELKLVIEIDGSIHNREDVKLKDSIRENDLVDFGITVLRFTNKAVLNQLRDVIKTISDTVIKINEELNNKEKMNQNTELHESPPTGGFRGQERLKQLFAVKKNNILNIYCTAGYPALDATVEVMKALQENGADIIELGMPYSDPLADGEVIQASSSVALQNGMTIAKLFEQLASFRQTIHVPVILMGYMNPVLQFGIENFCAKAKETGVDGVILPDLPMYEYETVYKPLFDAAGLDFIFLVTPETGEERIRKIDALGSGFIYAVSSSSTTGKNKAIEDQEAYFKKLQSLGLNNPVLVGFGIKDQQTFAAASRYTNGAIIGSAYIKALEKSTDISQTTKEFLKNIIG